MHAEERRRLLGDEGIARIESAHGDLADEPMPSEDAEAIVALMDEILEEVYQGPARMLALKRSRLEREQRNAAKKAGAQNGS